ncbi:hypothetical protein SAMN02745823_03733 [Sporobacter termitidis DSM 10068]|uniref:Dolichyl-phosphate-mannose-protein mannosyltransferase n=1 Tax=Sporobacter termitidis DSM 10068 TaxID=1123282 RepID=A0A1M5ZH23_9FIRM|nr:hypothetical protein [Sporobacter termitidis]SHI23530.1 hypothetical protein SAMN02745823_03733 [Sporobacter termitidis DSM 10068]
MNQGGLLYSLKSAGLKQKKNLLLLIYCVLVSAVFLGLCSKSSFLYPFNDWGDANCFFTVGKSMLNGKVLYRDIYDQKGPLLYLLHGLAWLVSHESFFGVYLLEVVFFSGFLWVSAKTVRLLLPESAVYILLPVLSALILSSAAFSHGDSAEELSLPLVAAALYTMVRYYKSGYPEDLSYKTVLLNGVFAGCVLSIKFNLAGFHIAWLVSILLALLIKKKLRRALMTFLVFLGGAALVLLPWLLYFGLNHALRDFYNSYVFNNIFLYSKITDLTWLDHIFGRIFNILVAFLENLQFSILIVIGLAAVLITHDYGRSVVGRLSLVLGFVCLLAGIFAGDVAYQYYPLILGAFSLLGLIAVLDLIYPLLPKRPLRAPLRSLIVLAFLGAALAFSWARSSNVYLLGERREDMAQYKFRDIIRQTDNPTLLNYGFLDFGEYTVCGIVPTSKYFCGLNIQLPDIQKTQDEFIADKKVDYVITRNYTPAFILLNYAVVSQQQQYFEGKTDTYYLLERLP